MAPVIRVQGRNPTTVLRRLDHHAPELVPLAQSLLFEIVFGPLGQDESVHRLRQHKKGANSFSLTTSRGNEFHFRSRDYESVQVLDSFKNGRVIATIETPEEATHFVQGVAEAEIAND